MANAAELRGVTKVWGPTEALAGVSLGIQADALTAILGPSGCGKTTLLRVLAGLEDPEGGEVWIGNRRVASPLSEVDPEDRGVALVFQDLALWPHMTVRENIAFPLETRIRDAAARAQRVEEAAEQVEIGHRLDVRPATLSGGERQRAALARALAGEPELLLLDEPFSGLDAALRLRLLEVVADVRQRRGITALLVTHDQQEALGAADRVVVMQDGRVSQEGTPQEVYAAPRSRFTAGFVGLASFLAATDSGDGHASTAWGAAGWEGAPPGADGRMLLAARPEDVVLDPEAGTRGSVRRSLFRGDGWLVAVQRDGARLLVRHAEAVAAGTEVGVRFTRALRSVEDGEAAAVGIPTPTPIEETA